MIEPLENRLLLAADFGDAPDTGPGVGTGNYNTLFDDSGPQHTVDANLFMGGSIDMKVEATPNDDANGDDIDSVLSDDEDGLNNPLVDLSITTLTQPKVNVTVTNKTGSNATLTGWIDYDMDGEFENAERAQPIVVGNTMGGVSVLTFPIVPAESTGTTYARFRLSTDLAGQDPIGLASDGEVEDYLVTIVTPSFGTVDDEQKISAANNNFLFNGLSDGDQFGAATANIGDLDGNGVDDLAVGAPNDDDDGDNRGAVWILFLNSDGTVLNHTKISDTSGNFLGTLEDGDRFGRSLASLGDLDGDGVVDLAVGAPDDDGIVIDPNDSLDRDRGAVWILLLNDNGTVKGHQKLDELSLGGAGSINALDRFGTSVSSIGDLNRDGVTDIAVGSIGDDDGGTNHGAVRILFLNSDGTVASHQKISSTMGDFLGTLAIGDQFGKSVANLGDLDGDGVTDMAVGALGDTGFQGAAWILFLKATGTVKGFTKIDNTELGGGLEPVDLFGEAIASLGDLDGDGVTDIAVGALADDDGGDSRGAVWVLFLDDNGTVKDHQKISDTDGGFDGVLANSDLFGSSLTSFDDLDGDGTRDLAVGAFLDADSGTAKGAVWILNLTPENVDFGDAPAPYPTLLEDDGARHEVAGANPLRLGTTIDIDSDGQPNMSATGDDDDSNPSDEDGINFNSTLHVGQLDAQITVIVQNATNAKLDAWIDFNGDGSWGGVSERIAASLPVVDGINTVFFAVPSDSISGNTYARFRLSSIGGLGPSGSAADGEVEDYVVTILAPKTSGRFTEQDSTVVGTLSAIVPQTADIDGDNRLDILLNGFDSGRSRLSWWQNTAGNGSTWNEHVIDVNSHAYAAVDLNRDGYLDVLGKTDGSNLVWWKNVSGDGTSWAEQYITSTHLTRVQAADLDGDGDFDVVGDGGLSTSWLENVDGEGTVWAARSVNADFPDAYIQLADVDSDGDIDIVGASGTDGLSWWDNTAGDGTAWTEHYIGNFMDGFVRSLQAVDMNGDSNIDVLAANYYGQVYWWENSTGDGLNWTEQEVYDDCFNICPMVATAGDLDGDGDMDVLGAEFARSLRWWENISGNATIWLENEIISDNYGNAGIAIGDIDSDGDIDVIGHLEPSIFTDTVVWWENHFADFGDAPDPYPTTLVNDGARHDAEGPKLGSLRDIENDGQPTTNSISDDLLDEDDEDGVTFGSQIRAGVAGAIATVNVSDAPSGARLDAWIDFDGDGIWESPEEQIANSLSVVNGDNNVLFTPPLESQLGSTWARFRISSSGGLTPTGLAVDGEVEDHPVEIRSTSVSVYANNFDDPPVIEHGVTAQSSFGSEWPSGGNGYEISYGGQGTFGISQANGEIISFSLALPMDTDEAGPTGGLLMNHLNGSIPNDDVGTGGGGSPNLVRLDDPTEWHEFWIQIRPTVGEPGTHKVTVHVDGAADPETFFVTSGTKTAAPGFASLEMGMPNPAFFGAVDIDMFSYRDGLHPPNANGSIFDGPSNGGWTYAYGGDCSAFCSFVLDGAWFTSSNSDDWDFSAPGSFNNPGGVVSLSEAGTTFLRIQDTGDPSAFNFDSPSNKNIYFDRDVAVSGSPLDGITLGIRARIPTPDIANLDPVYNPQQIETSVRGFAELIGSTSDRFAFNLLRNDGEGNPIEKTTLVLDGLPVHDSIDLNFLAAIIDSWDGNNANGPFAPDLFNVEVDGNLVFQQSLDNQTEADQDYLVPSAVRMWRDLGFDSSQPDAAYDFWENPVFGSIPHEGTNLKISWFADGAGWQGGDDESFALDNIGVSLLNDGVRNHLVYYNNFDGLEQSLPEITASFTDLAEPWPANGDGYTIHNGGQGMFGVRQSNDGAMVSFSLALPTDTDEAGSGGLIMNHLNGDEVSQLNNVDTGGDGEARLVPIADVNQWHEFWITIEKSGDQGTHRAVIYKDGELMPSGDFEITAGFASFSAESYLTMGLGSTQMSGAVDVDFFSYLNRVEAPTAANGMSYTVPPEFWDYVYQGDCTRTAGSCSDPNDFIALDGTWDHNNPSDAWDGSAPHEPGSSPGGAGTFSDQATDDFLRIQDTGDPRVDGFLDPGSNRKINFLHELQGVSPTILDDGITLSFRARIPRAEDMPQFDLSSVEGFDGLGTDGTRFGGVFFRNKSTGNPAAKTELVLTGLPGHDHVDLRFLAAFIDSWDGDNSESGTEAPDFFNVEIDGVPIFRKTIDTTTNRDQSYLPPNTRTNGILHAKLGFNDNWPDAGYNLGADPTFDHIPHTDDKLTVSWYANGDGWQGGDDESFGIDNLEVIAHDVCQSIVRCDFGDAPDSYPTLWSEDGARHWVVPNSAYLGSTPPDAEPDGIHSPTDGDDMQGGDDEDGVSFDSTINVGQLNARFFVDVSAPDGASSKLNAWIDFNGDGAWDGPSEQIANDRIVFDGIYAIRFDVPSWAKVGSIPARIRISSKGGLAPRGFAPDGEVEDFLVDILPAEQHQGFIDPSEIASLASATGVFVADLEDDADMDILATSFADDAIVWYDDDTDFMTQRTIDADLGGAFDVLATDLDSDGDLDVLGVGSSANEIRWYEYNDANCTPFCEGKLVASVNNPLSAFPADLDGDGDTDVLTVSTADSSTNWFKNNGKQEFSKQKIDTASFGSPRTITAADINGNGYLDVIAGYSPGTSPGTIVWWANDGDANFTNPQVLQGGTGDGDVIAADVDLDGDMDLIATGFSNDTVAWYENELNGLSFTEHILSQDTDGPDRLFAADLDGDQDLDIVTTAFNADTVVWFVNDGNQVFAPTTLPTTADQPFGLYVADIERDGDLDILTASFNGNSISIYENASRDFGDAPAPYPTLLANNGASHIVRPDSPILGSLNVDGELDGQPNQTATGDDLVSDDEDGVTFNSTIHVGQLDAQVDIYLENASNAMLDAWIDFNADGSWDGPGEQIANNLQIQLFGNTVDFDVPSWAVAGSTFARFRVSKGGNLSPRGMALDGEVEDYQITIEPPSTGGLFSDAITITSNAMGAVGVYAANLDGDYDQDILSASNSDNRVVWYEKNDATPGYTAHDIDDTATGAFDVLAVDLDGDNDKDVVATMITGVRWYKNDGNGSFSPPEIVASSSDINNPLGIFAADVNGDGFMDVLTASSLDNTFAWYSNDGSQNFTKQTLTDSDGRPSRIAAADINQDGHLDILTSEWTTDTLAWWENDGLSLNFTKHPIVNSMGSNINVTTGQGPFDILGTDIDRDGDIDLVATFFQNDMVAWYENKWDPANGYHFIEHVLTKLGDNGQPQGDVDGPEGAFATDIDGDSDVDVVVASLNDDSVHWFENDGSQNFTLHTITTSALSAFDVHVADVDDDGDLDVLSASVGDNRIAWYENSGPPQVVSVLVGSTSWTNEFRTNVLSTTDGFFPVASDADQLQSIPWTINQVRIRFSENVSVRETDLFVSGTNNAEYAVVPSSLQYNNTTFEATWTIDPVSRDKLYINVSDLISSVTSGLALDGEFTTGAGLPSGDGTAGGDLHFRVNVLAGDADRNGENSLNDLQILATNWQQATTLLNFFADFDGSNDISLNDLQNLATNWQQKVADILDPPIHNFAAPAVIEPEFELWDLGFDEIMDENDNANQDDEFDRIKKRQQKFYRRAAMRGR